jgi:hypothetical protein
MVIKFVPHCQTNCGHSQVRNISGKKIIAHKYKVTKLLLKAAYMKTYTGK